MKNELLSIGKLERTAEYVTVIMAGGSGTRFWPLSRADRPKQFLPLSPDGRSLIQATASRLDSLKKKGEVLVVTAENQIDLVRKHLPEAKILAEPMPKNTAACLGYAAAKILEEIGDVPMVCLPSDHLISGVGELTRTYSRAIDLTKTEDVLVTIGIPPSYPETGYGYIRRDSPLANSEHSYLVHSFVEKPNKEKAKEYLASGEYFWNSGMFIWRAEVIWKAFSDYMPSLAAQLFEIRKLAAKSFPEAECRALYSQIDPISIDYGVMEKAKNVVMLAGVGFRWSDVGSWNSWKETMEEARPSEDRNVTEGDVLLVNSEDTLVVGSKKFIAGVGLQGLIVVETDDAILVCTRESAQDVRKVVDLLKSRSRTELL